MIPTPCSFVPSRAGRRARRVGRVGLAWIGVLACCPFASLAEEPIRLGSEHIGMTAEGLSETNVASTAPTAGPESAPPAPSEWKTGADPWAAADPEPGSDPWAATDPEPGASPVATSYEECVERAIRAGDGFRAASGVCQARFPEPVAPSPAAERSAQAEATVGAASGQAAPVEAGVGTAAPPSGGSSQDDGPLVLTLDGPVPSGAGSASGD